MASQWVTDVKLKESESDIIASQWATDVKLNESDKLNTAAQCSVEAVDKRSRLRRVSFESCEMVSQCSPDV
jgi:hypothetical protein